MRLHVDARLDYDFPREAEALLHVEPAHGADQTVIAETLNFDPPVDWTRLDDATTGERRVVFRHQGPLKIAYIAAVDLLPRDNLLTGAEQHPIAALPVEVLPFLRASRFIESDRFEPKAEQDFGDTRGGDRVEAIIAWLRSHLDYRSGTSDARTTASDAYMTRTGVCRDYAHLAAALCRASDIPARLVSAYALDLKPQDFHAVIEVFVGDRWRLADPTGLVSPDRLVRIGQGRDAADIPFLTIFGQATMMAQSVNVWADAHVPAEPAAA